MSINLDDFVIRRGSTGDVTGVTVDTATGLTGGGTSGDIPIAIGTVPLANGGTGATTAAAARTALGLGNVAVLSTSDIFTRHVDSSNSQTSINYDSYIKYVTATGPLGTTITGSGTSADPYVITLTSPDTTGSSYTLPAATSSALGGVKIISTASSAPMQLVTTTANRNYSIQHMTGAQAMVNVPWTDTTYSLATASVSGLCQVYNSIEANSTVCEEEVEGRRYKIQHDSDSDLSVCVPWTDTVYTHPTTAGNKHIPSGGSSGDYLRHTGTSGTAAWTAFPTTISVSQANAITANTAKVTFPGIGTSSTTCMAGNTSIPVDLTVSGAGTVHADNYTNTEPNSTNVAAAGALMDSELTDLAGVKGMTVANKADLASPTFTGTPAAPTAADGTNTTQIATTAFVKQELDARYSYQYINFSFKVSGISNENWYFPGQDGVNYYVWGNNVAGSADPVDVAIGTTITVDRYDYQSGIIIPKACELVSFHGQIRHHGYLPNTIHPVFALFKAAMPSDGTTSDLTPSCIAFNDDSLIGSGNRLNRINKIESTHTASLSAYDIIYPAAGANANPTSNGTIRGAMTIVLKTLIP